MSSKSPIFPTMPEPQHFSDYGFHPQMHYFQVLEESRNRKKEASSSSSSSLASTSIDSLHLKLQTPISKVGESKYRKSTKKKRWWRNALLFFKWKGSHQHGLDHDDGDGVRHHPAGARALRVSISGPVYRTESRSGSSTPFRSTRRPSSGPLVGTLNLVTKGDVQVPYLSLRDLNMEQQPKMLISATPIYLVT